MIRKRKNSKGQFRYQVIICNNDGHPSKYKTFSTTQEAKDWVEGMSSIIGIAS